MLFCWAMNILTGCLYDITRMPPPAWLWDDYHATEKSRALALLGDISPPRKRQVRNHLVLSTIHADDDWGHAVILRYKIFWYAFIKLGNTLEEQFLVTYHYSESIPLMRFFETVKRRWFSGWYAQIARHFRDWAARYYICCAGDIYLFYISLLLPRTGAEAELLFGAINARPITISHAWHSYLI